MYKKTIVICFWIVNITSCRTQIYLPGFDFALFSNSPAKKLAKAVESEDTTAISAVLEEHYVDVNYTEAKFGNTLLTLAVINNKNLSVPKLLEMGADPNKRANDNSSPFLNACAFAYDLKNPEETLRLLIDHGADVNSIRTDTTNDQFGNKKNFRTTPLRLLCIHGTLSEVKLIVEHGANLTNYGGNEHSILSTAALAERWDIVKYLLIEKKVPVPDYVVVRQPGNRSERKITLADILHELDYSKNPEQQKLKEEILRYLADLGKA
jgi:ankyrin repeat protein